MTALCFASDSWTDRCDLVRSDQRRIWHVVLYWLACAIATGAHPATLTYAPNARQQVILKFDAKETPDLHPGFPILASGA